MPFSLLAHFLSFSSPLLLLRFSDHVSGVAMAIRCGGEQGSGEQGGEASSQGDYKQGYTFDEQQNTHTFRDRH